MPRIVEGDGGTQLLTFTVTRSDNTGAFSVDYTTANGTAVAGSDFVGVSGAPNTINFTAGGALSQQVSIVINGDVAVEAERDLRGQSRQSSQHLRHGGDRRRLRRPAPS